MGGDYISNLPEGLKEKILSKLPIREAVQTSILSSKWKDLWTSISSLVFEERSTKSRLIKLVDNVLMVHHGPILEFKLVSRHSCNRVIGRWMLILSRNGIRNLELSIGGAKRCKIPRRLFSCLALERVYLSHCIINVLQLFQGFKMLHTLSLQDFDVTGISMGNLLLSCPLLECLALFDFVQQGCLNILAPNLRHVTIIGTFHDLCLDTPKLVSAFIFLFSSEGGCKQFSVAKAGKEKNITRVVCCLQNIQNLNVRGDFIEYLAMGPIPENLPTIFNRLTKISVDALISDRNEIAPAICLFQNAPNVKVLDIMLRDYVGEDQTQVQTLLRSKATEDFLFKCLEVVSIMYEPVIGLSLPGVLTMLDFAKLVLSTAPLLQKLNIIHFQYALAFVRELECSPKLSKKAEILVTSDEERCNEDVTAF